MINLLYSYINFWPGFNNSNLRFFIDMAKSEGINILPNSLKTGSDILFCSVFGDIDKIIKHPAKIKILLTRENLDHESYVSYRNNLQVFDIVLGFVDKDNMVNIPYYYYIIKNHSLDLNISDLNKIKINNRKNACLISANPHYLRLKILNSFQQHKINIDCPSIVGHNMNIFVTNKIKFIRNYYFNICPENSYSVGYTTEKLFDCCIAGCVPIYYGCEGLCGGFYDKDRILHIKNDLSNYDQIIDEAIRLIKNKSELLEFASQKPFATNYINYILSVDKKLKNTIHQILEKL